MNSEYLNNLYEISKSIGTSLNLEKMLDRCLNMMIYQTESMGGSILFFKDSIDKKIVYKNIFSIPSDVDNHTVFKEALKSIGSLHHNMEWESLKNKLPVIGKTKQGSVDINYYVFLLPHTGLLLLFKYGKPVEEEMIIQLIPLMDHLASACSACLQKTELDMVSASTNLINNELKKSETELKQTIQKMKKVQTEVISGRNHMAMILQSLGEGVIVVDKKHFIDLMNVKAMEYLDVIPDAKTNFKLHDIFKNCELQSEELYNFLSETLSEDSYIDTSVKKGHNLERNLRITKTHIRDVFKNAPEIILLLRDTTIEKEVDRVKNEFISNLSHELRTPMNAILGISKVLGKKKSENLNEHQIEGLNMITESGNRLLSLINDLLDMSKIEAGKMEINNHTFSLNKIISSLEPFTKGLISEKKIKYSWEIETSVPDQIYSDSQRLYQVLANILGNAVKYTEQGSVHLKIWHKKNQLYFECSDTGIGISKFKLPSVFERFKQADGSSSRKYEGTGLGLALSKEFIELMNGKINIVSEENEGTSVTFHIPLQVKQDKD